MHGKLSTAEKLYEKQNHDKCVGINVTIPQKLLTQVERDIQGKNRSKKLVACILAGYQHILGGEKQ